MKASIISAVALVAAVHAGHNDTMVTSTILATSTSTIISCAPTVTDCPVGKVTQVVYETTTICPATAVYPPAPPKPTAPPATYTVVLTSTATVESCAPTVVNCPYGSVTTGVYTSVVTGTPSIAVLPPVSTDYVCPGSPYCPAPETTYTAPPAPPATTAAYVCPGSPYCPAVVTSKIYANPAPSASPVKPAGNSTVPFTGGASVQKAGGLLMAFGFVAALL
ncbi:hypothetical protein BJ875DRAFT_444391 [Amylocarpus encephaloides]|uniref:GPI anchored serine-rich protein n=1 Tax=Amylocarpus encephaloides TaxID=45428 RepID=A0A9P8C286_9HELO|nr:hypothetical protein BJ875DRAFT_444391 [Amylocarpus encephaloides]